MNDGDPEDMGRACSVNHAGYLNGGVIAHHLDHRFPALTGSDQQHS
ncbi:MAG: hypothetical protein ACREEM_54870 [Blastocatellia bacterium]